MPPIGRLPIESNHIFNTFGSDFVKVIDRQSAMIDEFEVDLKCFQSLDYKDKINH